MQIDLENLPHDPQLLHRLVRDMATVLEDERAQHMARLAASQSEIEKLRMLVRQLQRAQFGRRSERLDPDQMLLGFDDLNADIGRIETHAPIPETGLCPEETGFARHDLSDNLPHKEIVLLVDQDACPGCGGTLHHIGDSMSEMLDWVPAQLRVLRIRRPKYGCRACGTIHQAAAPERAIAKGLATPALLAQVLVSKYCDHIPLYRQAQIFARHNVDLGRSTLANWVGGACWWLEGLQARLARHVFASGKIFADDTPVPVLDPGRGRTRTGRLWVYARDDRAWAGSDPPAAVYFYSPDRKGERPAAHLEQFRGVLQVDGYAGFERLTASGRIILAACWAHARRKFYDLHEATGSPIAAEALRRIAELYAIETRIRGHSAQDRKDLRNQYARPLVDAMKSWFEVNLGRIPGRSKLAEAIRYALTRWAALSRFLDDGRIELDTNPVERAIRPIALGRKNHLFAGSDGGGERWATVCSLIETAKLNGVEPFAYLADVLERMSKGHPQNRLDDLLPWNWTPSAPVQ